VRRIPSVGDGRGRAGKFIDWRARLEADGGGLENRYECKLIKGSNPLPSANQPAGLGPSLGAHPGSIMGR
jgi:hypothetical protein